MTPQRASELEAELRRLAAEAGDDAEVGISRIQQRIALATEAALIVAADLVRDAAREG